MSAVTIEETGFTSSGVRCAATLYLPDDTAAAGPAVVLGYGFGAIRRMRAENFPERFAEAGIVAMAFDYRYWGDSAGQPRQLLNLRRQLQDWRNAIEFVRSHPRVDPARVAVWGSSLSGGHVQHLAARDHRLAAAIAQVPLADGAAATAAGGVRHALQVAAASTRDIANCLTGRSRHRMKIFGPQGDWAAMANAEVVDGYARLLPPQPEWDAFGWSNDVPAARLMLLPMYRPGRRAHRIRCPILYQIADRDTVTPPAQALRAARRAPRAEVHRYPVGHFDVYQNPAFEQLVNTQIDFLRRHLTSDAAHTAAEKG